MIFFPSPMLAKADGPPPATGPVDPATLFGGGEAGGFWNFTDGPSLAVNADGTGGTPAIGSACRWTSDLGPNGKHLRNTIASATRRAGGIETSGGGYGLYNFPGSGWSSIPQPFEVVACLTQIAFAATDSLIIGLSGAAPALLQGSASGKLRFWDGPYAYEHDPGLGVPFVIAGKFAGAASGSSIDDGAMQPGGGGGASLSELWVGSSSGGACTSNIFKHLLVIGRVLTAGERSGVVEWMQA